MNAEQGLRPLRFWHPLAKIGVLGLVIAMVGGAAVSGMFMALHHGGRDERPGLTIDDIRAHYHGITAPAPLLAALRDGHPEPLDARRRDLLIKWLEGDSAKLGEAYDNLDLGEDAPSEIIAANCLACHARGATGPDAYPALPLDYWDDVRAVAISRDVKPVDGKILAASTHTHALAMASMGIVMALLAVLTRWPRAMVGLVLAAMGLGLVADVGGWWLTTLDVAFVWSIVVGGAAFNGGIGLLGVMVLADLVLPTRTPRA